MQNFSLSRQFFKDVWLLTKSYWQSEEKKKACFRHSLYADSPKSVE